MTQRPDLRPVVSASAGESGRGPVVALTFDDGSAGPTTEALLGVLELWGVRATFCVVGAQVQGPDGARVLRQIVAGGHALANHAMSYADLGNWDEGRVEAELEATNLAIRTAVGDPGAEIPWFRAPNGSWGCSAAVAHRLGMTPLGVVNTIDDWRTQHVPTLVRNLRAAVRPGGLVVAHDGGGDRRGTVAAVATVLPELLDAGWRFTLPEGAQNARPRPR